jgi:hypothetical protein
MKLDFSRITILSQKQKDEIQELTDELCKARAVKGYKPDFSSSKLIPEGVPLSEMKTGDNIAEFVPNIKKK